MKNILEDFGLTNSEIKIYRMLLNYGTSNAGEISKKTGIHRRNVYDSLERLIHKGFVSYIKENNMKKFNITNPGIMSEEINRRQSELDKMMPELISKFNSVNEKKETLFFKGKTGLKLIFEDQIRSGNEILVNATSVKVSQILKYFFPKYQLLRKEHNIKTRMIFDAVYKKANESEIKKLPLCRVRYIKDFNKSPMSQYIYGDNVALVVWSEDPIAILIRQKEVACGFRDSFEIMWKLAK